MKSNESSRKGGPRGARAANNARRKRRRSGRLRFFRSVVLLFLFSAGVVLSLTVFFKIEAVSVIGTDRYDPGEVADASGVEKGSNLFRINKEEIMANIAGNFPYIDTVEVNRRLPSTVEIHVTQCVPEGAVKEDENYVFITKGGKVLERGIMYIPENVPLIVGIDTAGVKPGDYLGVWEKTVKKENETEEEKNRRLKADEEKESAAARTREALVMLAYLFDAMRESGFTNITNVDVSDRLNMRVMYENRLVLELGSEADMAYKLELLQVIITEKLEPEARGTLFAANARDKKVRFRPDDDYYYSSGQGEQDYGEDADVSSGDG